MDRLQRSLLLPWTPAPEARLVVKPVRAPVGNTPRLGWLDRYFLNTSKDRMADAYIAFWH